MTCDEMLKKRVCLLLTSIRSRLSYHNIDVPARIGGGLLNGLSSDDLDDDEYVDEDSDELMAIRNTGNRLGGQTTLTIHVSRSSAHK